MGRLDPEARMTIKTLAARGATNSHIARLLGVTEGAVRHHVARLQAGALDGRSRQEPKAACVAAAIDHWRQMQDEGPINLALPARVAGVGTRLLWEPALDPALLGTLLPGSGRAGPTPG